MGLNGYKVIYVSMFKRGEGVYSNYYVGDKHRGWEGGERRGGWSNYYVGKKHRGERGLRVIDL